MAKKKDWSKAWKNSWRPGETAYFEYHCEPTHTSGDAQLWYRSHQPVTITGIYERGIGKTAKERADDACPRSYWVRFQDGAKGVAIEDELLTHPMFWERRFRPPPLEEIEAHGGFARTIHD